MTIPNKVGFPHRFKQTVSLLTTALKEKEKENKTPAATNHPLQAELIFPTGIKFKDIKNFVFPASVNSRNSRGEYLEATLSLVTKLASGHPERRIQLIAIDQPQMINHLLFDCDAKAARKRAEHSGKQYEGNCLRYLNDRELLVLWCGKNGKQKEKTKFISDEEKREIKEAGKKSPLSKEQAIQRMQALSHLAQRVTSNRLGNYDTKDPSYQNIRTRAQQRKEGIIELSCFQTRFGDIQCDLEDPCVKAMQKKLRNRSLHCDFHQLVSKVLEHKLREAAKNPDAQHQRFFTQCARFVEQKQYKELEKICRQQRKYIELYLLLDFVVLKKLKDEAEKTGEITAHLYDEQTENFGPAGDIFALARRVVPPSSYFIYGGIKFTGQEKREAKSASLKNMGHMLKERISPTTNAKPHSPFTSDTTAELIKIVDLLMQSSPEPSTSTTMLLTTAGNSPILKPKPTKLLVPTELVESIMTSRFEALRNFPLPTGS